MRTLASVPIVVAVLFQPIATSAQNQPLKFEVTSVKPNTIGRGGYGDMPPSGRVNMASIFTAMQEEFGLKLESSKGPVEVLVIESVSRPTEN